MRFGKVHVYNNVYRADKKTNYRSSWGAGIESQIYAENNYFEMSNIFGPTEVIDGKKGTRITVSGNCWKEKGACEATDFLAAVQRAVRPGPAAGCGLEAHSLWFGQGGRAGGVSTRTGAARKWPRTGQQQ